MARQRVITRKTIVQKKTPIEEEDDDTSTEESTKEDDGGIGEEEEEENTMEKNNMEDGNGGSIRPENMTIDVGSIKDVSSTSTLGTNDDGVKRGGLLSVIEKSKLMNWAEDNFLREYKILTYEEAANKTEVHEVICETIGIEKTNWAIVGSEIIKRLRSALSDRVSLHRKVVRGLYYDYLANHEAELDKFSVTMQDCAKLFRKVPYDGGDPVVRDKWRLIGNCLSKVCTKRCTWSELEIRAMEANVCTFTTHAEEAIVYWLFVSEGDDWVKDFRQKNNEGQLTGDGNDTTAASERSQRKKNGKHKTLAYLKHWWQLRSLVEARRNNRVISQGWDEALKSFACEDLENKKSKRVRRKRTMKDVLPTFEDVLGVGEQEGTYGKIDLKKLCTQTSEI